MRLALRVEAGARGRVPSATRMRRWAREALRGLKRERVAVGVRVVEGSESARLNRRYRGKTGSTNVLSFPFDPPPGVKSEVLGDLVLCAPVIRREARAQGKLEDAHWAHMVVHGIMHLLGYDHQTRREAAIMERKETRALERLGYTDPYVLPFPEKNEPTRRKPK